MMRADKVFHFSAFFGAMFGLGALAIVTVPGPGSYALLAVIAAVGMALGIAKEKTDKTGFDKADLTADGLGIGAALGLLALFAAVGWL